METLTRAVELDITSDVYVTQDGAAYNSPSEAIEDALDNCLNGMDETLVTSETPRKIQIVFHTPTKGGGIPTTIDIIDNGIGMSEGVVLNSLFLTNIDNAGSHGEGGTSTWGMGYKAFTNYLGKPGEVCTRTVEQAKLGLDGTRAKVFYEKGKKPYADVTPLSSDLFLHECSEIAENGHGTKITIRDIKTSKWSNSWWNPQGQTYSKSWAKRYNRLLQNGKLEIELIQKTPGKIFRKTLEPSQKVLDSNPHTDVEHQDTNYISCSRNSWNIKGDGLEIEGYNENFPTNIGKHLSKIQSKPWNSIGSISLISHSVAKSANPTVYLYQNDVLVATIPFKDNERTGGLAHLNGLFVEVDVPSGIRIPTNLQKSSVDSSFKEAVLTAVKRRAEELWKPINVSEAEYHRIFHEMTLNIFQGKGIRDGFFDGKSVDELKGGLLVHEHQQGSMKPDFKFYDDNKVVKRVIEFKDEQCNAEVAHQLAAYKLEYETAEEVILIAPGFKETLTQTLNKWSKTSGVKFSYYSFADLGIKEISSLK
jgi:hypothetical protein